MPDKIKLGPFSSGPVWRLIKLLPLDLQHAQAKLWNA